jgi:hypothetical protein
VSMDLKMLKCLYWLFRVYFMVHAFLFISSTHIIRVACSVAAVACSVVLGLLILLYTHHSCGVYVQHPLEAQYRD